MTGIAFEVPGTPVAKGRARSTSTGRHYTPQKTRDGEGAVSYHAMTAMLAAEDSEPMSGPLSLSFLACIPVPASWSDKKRKAALTSSAMPISRPDLDNYCKLIADGINGIVYKDDAQIVHLSDCLKVYSANPRLCVRVEPFDPDATYWLQSAEFMLTSR